MSIGELRKAITAEAVALEREIQRLTHMIEPMTESKRLLSYTWPSPEGADPRVVLGKVALGLKAATSARDRLAKAVPLLRSYTEQV